MQLVLLFNVFLFLQVPSSQRQGGRREVGAREHHKKNIAVIKSLQLSSLGSTSSEQKFVEHSVNFSRIWSSEREPKGRCTFCRKQVSAVKYQIILI